MKTVTEDLNLLIRYIEEKIKPHSLSKLGKDNIGDLLSQFDIDALYEAIDISFKSYIDFNEKGEPTADSTSNFLQKIGGIAHNNSLSPLEKKLKHVKNICSKRFHYWDETKATILLKNYVKAMEAIGWNENQILNDLNDELITETNNCTNWTEWRSLLEVWTDLLIQKKTEMETNSHTLINMGFLTIKKKYKIIKEIGSGSFGITYEVSDINLEKKFVLKEFSSGFLDKNRNESFFKKFIKEIKILFELHHQNIVNIYDYAIDIKKQVGYYIMEYIDGSNIFEYLKNNQNMINSIFEQVISVFSYLELNHICHRDIRINNILITKCGIVKLIDFGFVKDISNSNSVNSSTQLISYPYDWPEELKDKNPKYNCSTEIYFIGKLFQDIIEKLAIKDFKYKDIMIRMIKYSYIERLTSFISIDEKIKSNNFS